MNWIWFKRSSIHRHVHRRQGHVLRWRIYLQSSGHSGLDIIRPSCITGHRVLQVLSIFLATRSCWSCSADGIMQLYSPGGVVLMQANQSQFQTVVDFCTLNPTFCVRSSAVWRHGTARVQRTRYNVVAFGVISNQNGKKEKIIGLSILFVRRYFFSPVDEKTCVV